MFDMFKSWHSKNIPTRYFQAKLKMVFLLVLRNSSPILSTLRIMFILYMPRGQTIAILSTKTIYSPKDLERGQKAYVASVTL